MIKHVVFCGGGSGGHVMPALTIIEKLQRSGIAISYIGSRTGIEAKLVRGSHLPYYAIATGKLRRYFSFQNFIDPFKIIWGMLQAFALLVPLKRKTTLVFSTGGFVSVPVVVAARVLGFKVFIHEQTSRVGLANKIAGKLAHKIFISFESSRQFFPSHKVVFSGYPVREECFSSKLMHHKVAGVDLDQLKKPLFFITGGGNGSLLLNEAVKREMNDLKAKYFVIHQVGGQFLKEYSVYNDENYHAADFVGAGMIDLYKKADIVVSRAGAGTVCELMALGKPSVFVPLKIAQHNEQFHNAKEAETKIGSMVILEDDLKSVSLTMLRLPSAKEVKQDSKAIDIIVKEIRHV